MSLSGLKNRNGGKGKKGQEGKAGGEPLAPAAWVGATISVAPAAPLFYLSRPRAKALGCGAQCRIIQRAGDQFNIYIYTNHIQWGSR